MLGLFLESVVAISTLLVMMTSSSSSIGGSAIANTLQKTNTKVGWGNGNNNTYTFSTQRSKVLWRTNSTLPSAGPGLNGIRLASTVLFPATTKPTEIMSKEKIMQEQTMTAIRPRGDRVIGRIAIAIFVCLIGNR
ncbi:hypothetical protein KCU81_g378, partial [Aureobasidium melanogenum]